MWSRLTSHEELLSLEEKATVQWMPVGICHGLVHRQLLCSELSLFTDIISIWAQQQCYSIFGWKEQVLMQDIPHHWPLMCNPLVAPIGLTNGATCGSGVRNATPSPTLYLRSDEWWAGNSERNGEFRGSTGKSWFVKRLREERCWPNFALVMSPWSLPGNLMGKKQSCAKTCREFHFNEENVSFLGYFSACQGIWKKKHVKNHTCKKKKQPVFFFPLTEYGY